MKTPPEVVSHIAGALHHVRLVMDAMEHAKIPGRYRHKVSVDEIIDPSRLAEEHLKAALTLSGVKQSFDMNDDMKQARKELTAYARELQKK